MSISERDETAILVKDGLHISGRHAMVMHQEWPGPKARLMHEGRVWRWVGIADGAVKVKVAAIHVPFTEAARDESMERLRRYFDNHSGPVIAAGDYNMGAGDLRKALRGTGVKVAGFGIDLVAYKGCKLIKAKRLGKHGSDHHAILYVFEYADAKGRKRRLRLIAWNVRVGHPHKSLRRAIRIMRRVRRAKVFCLCEMYGQHGHLDGLGYQVVQYAKTPPKKAPAKKAAKK